MSGAPWVFQQLGGAQKRIELNGWSAPFGRPRQKPVVEEMHKQRITTYRYPGWSGPPTRHVFGKEWEDMMLTGRWMDKELGIDGANEMVDTWHDFIDDAQLCQISWGDIVQYEGIVESIKVSRESREQVAWTLHILVDDKVGQKKSKTVVPFNFKEQVYLISQTLPQLPSTAPDWSPDFFDALDALISKINGLWADVVKLANAFDDFRSATSGQLRRLSAGLHQLKTAALDFQDTKDSFDNDTAVFARQAGIDVAWAIHQTGVDVDLAIMLAAIADIQRQIGIATRGKTITTYVAQLGDTWESISNAVYGGVSGAAGIRQANGIKYGTKPQPGKLYNIPTHS